MKRMNIFTGLTGFERALWAVSAAAIVGAFALSGSGDWLTAAASLIGVTALIFIARGYVAGQVLIVIFSLIYGLISLRLRYYGELITYVGMTAPMAILTAVEWLRHPYKGTREVEVSRLSRRRIIVMLAAGAAVTVAFYFILRALGNASLLVSTVSVTTSFAASYLTWCRSPWYAIGYAANDLVLIVLWAAASAQDISHLPMAVCFVMFFVNDLYGFVSWRRMQRRQA